MTILPATSPLAILGLGFLLGVRHALDVDHLAAISTILSARHGLLRSSLVGALWGLGHTASLCVVGAAIVLLRLRIPESAAPWFELPVAVMLIVLGGNLLRTLGRGGRLHAHPHDHAGRVHAHLHVHAAGDATHEHLPGRGGRSFLIGVVHGLAGSAALMLAVLATIPSPALALVYVATFGLGSVVGMMLMSTLLGVPMALAAGRHSRAEWLIRACAGVASVTLGITIAWEIGRTALL